MKKLVTVLFLVLGMSAMLVGCGTENKKTGVTNDSGNLENNEAQKDETQNNESQKDEAQKGETQNDESQKDEAQNDESQNKITEKMAFDGVNNYCHSTYDWSITEKNPDIMYVEMGEETDTEYQVTFRSYTGSFVYFYVDKTSGNTRMVEYVPDLDIKEEAGTINLNDYLD